MHKKGFDLFKTGLKSGKSLVEHMATTVAEIWLQADKYNFIIQTSKLTRELFDALSEAEPDFFAPIDVDGNTILHYVAGQEHEFLLPEFKVADLKRVPNAAAGKTPLETILEADEDFKFGAKIKSLPEFEEYIGAYDEFYGQGRFKAFVVRNFGGFIVLEALRKDAFAFDIFKFMFDEMQVSLERLMWVYSKNYEGYRDGIQLERVIDNVLYHHHPQCQEIQEALAIHGHATGSSLFLQAMRENSVDTVQYYLKHGKMVRMLCDAVNSCEIPFNEAFKVAVADERIAQYAKENLSFEKYFFTMCGCIEKMKFLHELGIDSRNLIARKSVHGNQVFILTNHVNFTTEMWQFLREHGWTSEDFDRLHIFSSAENKSSLYRYLQRHSQTFNEVFGRGEPEWTFDTDVPAGDALGGFSLFD